MNEIVTTPVFLLFVGVTFLLTLGYFWGRRRNQKVFLDAFNDLVGVVKPDDQTFTNIGGVVGYHANLYIKNKSPVTRVDATITLLPRHSWLYLPVSYLIMRYDRLFITFYVRPRMPGEFASRGSLVAGRPRRAFTSIVRRSIVSRDIASALHVALTLTPAAALRGRPATRDPRPAKGAQPR